jgi:RNA polymerase sigma factor (sigma-70 family)
MTLRSEGEAVEDLVRQYLREIGAYSLLTAADEVTLAIAMEAGREAAAILDAAGTDLAPARRLELRNAVAAGDAARRRFIQANLRLVVSIAKRYQSSGLPLLDLVQEGNLGLMRAVEKFEHRRGCKFSTYATWWIRQSVSRAIADKARTIRVPVHMLETTRRVARTGLRIAERTGKPATSAEIAAELGLLESVVVDAQNVIDDPVSLQAPLNDDGELGDLLEDRDAEAPFEEVTAKFAHVQLRRALEMLTAREQEVLQLRFGLSGSEPHTLEDVGRTFRLTRERIRQIEAKALTKLRHPVARPTVLRDRDHDRALNIDTAAAPARTAADARPARAPALFAKAQHQLRG